MDSSNLGVVFAPTIMRSIAEDHGTMLAEMGFSKSVVTHLIDNFSPYFVPAEAPEEASCNVVNDTTSLATSDTLDSSLSAQIESGLSLGMLSRVNMCTANNPVRAKSLSVALPAGILQLARETYKEENGRPSSSQINISEETLQQFEKGLSPEMVHRFQRQRNNSTGTLQPPLAAISESESKEDETSN